jgi:hypothetical protein
MRLKKCAYCLNKITGESYKKDENYFCSEECKTLKEILEEFKTMLAELLRIPR